jgi:hypothetical protein
MTAVEPTANPQTSGSGLPAPAGGDGLSGRHGVEGDPRTASRSAHETPAAPDSPSESAGEIFYGSKRYEVEPDPKPEKRIVDGTAEPLDSSPIDENYCPLCHAFTAVWQRCHLVSRGQGGDDVPENLFWACEDCHGLLPPQGTSKVVARRLVRYCRETVPELGNYADLKKYPGYLEWRYLGEAA